MKSSTSFPKFLILMLFDLVILLLLGIGWLALFILVFFCISSMLGGIFLLLSSVFSFHINIIPTQLYDYPLLLFSYSFCLIGLGGLALVLTSVLLSYFVGWNKKYYLWNMSLWGLEGENHEK